MKINSKVFCLIASQTHKEHIKGLISSQFPKASTSSQGMDALIEEGLRFCEAFVHSLADPKTSLQARDVRFSLST
jgi:hypothetical protein